MTVSNGDYLRFILVAILSSIARCLYYVTAEADLKHIDKKRKFIRTSIEINIKIRTLYTSMFITLFAIFAFVTQHLLSAIMCHPNIVETTVLTSMTMLVSLHSLSCDIREYVIIFIWGNTNIQWPTTQWLISIYDDRSHRLSTIKSRFC